MVLLPLLILLWALEKRGLCESPHSGLHVPIFRRGGRLARYENANLTALSEVLQAAELKYTHVHCSIEDNHLRRHWKEPADEQALFDSIGGVGQWYAKIDVGNPPQSLEFDLDMLSPDFYILMTTGPIGVKYNSFASTSHESNDQHVHSLCRNPADIFHFPLPIGSSQHSFAMCSPHKSSRYTLSSSGAAIGLGPLHNLARLSTPSILEELVASGVLSRKLWSLTLLDAESGILSLGDTLHEELEKAKVQKEMELKHFGDSMATPEWIAEQVQNHLQLSMPSGLDFRDHFKWTDVKGAEGWWTTLMSGVWVNGLKVLKNQPVLLDISCPFILAPPLAAQRFYEAVSGSRRLPPPLDNFFAFPCLNSPSIVFDIAGWLFPTMSGEGTRSEALHGPIGGKFSLGSLAAGSGYCVGLVVESRMSLHEHWSKSGMQYVWVLGEPFFRGLGVVFDAEEGRLGFRTY